MGGLGHYIEEEGVPTTQISLIREHTERIRPPRALWVPFELGRPLGVPNDPEFQERVLTAVLKLLERPQGPVIEDFPEEAPSSGAEETVWACPVSFDVPTATDLDTIEGLKAAFAKEAAKLHTWYDISLKTKGRTTVGPSGLSPDGIVEFVSSFLDGATPDSPRDDIPVGHELKLAVEDLRAFYLEAVTAQPGNRKPLSADLDRWFWGTTVAAKVIYKIKKRCETSDDDYFKALGRVLLVPVLQLQRVESTGPES